MKKSLFSIFASILFFVSLSGCDDSSSSSGGGIPVTPDEPQKPSPEEPSEPYADIIGKYGIDEFKLGDSEQDLTDNDTARVNSDKEHLFLNVFFKNLGNVYVYSEDPDTLMKSGLTKSFSPGGKTQLKFTLGQLAEINMTQQKPFSAMQGTGEKQEKISVTINEGKPITAQTSSFNVEISHTSGNNRYYDIIFYAGIQEGLDMPKGSYVGLDFLGDDTSDKFSVNTSACKTEKDKTTCTVSIPTPAADICSDENVCIAVVKETDSSGQNPTGAETIGLFKIQ